MTAGIAGNMAVVGLSQLGKGRRPSMRNLLLTPRNISRVADQLALMRGAAMKIGQLISMDTGEVLPPELSQIMARLRDDAHFMPPAQLKQVLNADWPKKWLQFFETFDVRPIAAASIGQVHRAKLKDGRDVAIKVQYPGVAKSIDSDVSNVGALIRMSGLLPKGFDLAPYLKEARKQLHEETDYEREAAHLLRFGGLLADAQAFDVPRVHADLCTPRILAMSYVEGQPIESAASQPQDVRNRIAGDLIDLTLQELFDFGVMQTDPNFANYFFNTETGRIVLLDFGATREIARDIQQKYKRLFVAGIADNEPGLTQAASDIGFFDVSTPVEQRDQIVDMMRTVFQAVVENRMFDFGQNDLSVQMQTKGNALAEAGFVPPPLPIDVLLLQRKFGGMFLLAKRLEARVNVLKVLERYV
jgi:predicted unusual protein kinase regulating ubiquinone biosynthesis (AarF/ABC1/UbiB family)